MAIYYWPNFHRDAYHQSKKGEGWNIVGDCQERQAEV